MGKIIAMTGVNGYAAATLLPLMENDPEIEKIIGIDISPWKGGFSKVEFVRQDTRSPRLADILRNVEIVCHLAPGENMAGEIDLSGTSNLLSACAENRIGKIICLSSTSVYSLSKERREFYSEEDAISDEIENNEIVAAGVAVEAVIDAFVRNHPRVTVTRIRAAILIGPNIDNWLEHTLSMRFIVLPKGKRKRIQFIHEEDLGRALETAVHQDLPGTYNVAADNTVEMHWCFRHAGAKVIPLPELLAETIAGIGYFLGIYPLSKDRIRLLSYGIVADNQNLKKACGWQPVYDCRNAFMSYADKLHHRRQQDNMLQAILSWIIKSGKRLKPFLPVLGTFRLGKIPGLRRLLPWLNPDQNTINYLPVNEGITVENTVLPSQVVHDLIENASIHVLMDKCGCRMLRDCQHYTHEIGCLFMGETALKLPHGVCQRVSKEAAHAHADRAMQLGLLPMTGKVRIDNFIYMAPDRSKLLSLCFCCDCCCILTSYKHVPAQYLDGIIEPIKGLVIEVTDNCTGCGTCLETCAFNAIAIINGRAVHNEQCRGCCRCERFCPVGAVIASIQNEHYAEEVINRIRSHVQF